MSNKSKLIVILGPTASGKSELAVEIAKRFNGEIISADSRQVYRGMNIGTGKITKKEMRGVPHYLLDVASPKRRFSVAQYKNLAQKAIEKILAKGKLPIICGGTGFYIQTLIDNLQIPSVKPNFKLRAKLEKKSATELYNSLKKLDPARAKTIDKFNKRRLIRALEIVYKTGKPVPPLKSPLTPPFGRLRASSKGGELFPPFEEGWGGFNTLFIGIKKSPQELKKLIAKRLQKRLRQGMDEEVKKLHCQGLSWQKLDDFGMEYRWIARYLRSRTRPAHSARDNKSPATLAREAESRTEGHSLPNTTFGPLVRGQEKISYPEMVKHLQKETEHYAKRQMTWFRKNKRIRWIKNQKEAHKLTKDFLKK